jgi:N-acetylglutamate synthase
MTFAQVTKTTRMQYRPMSIADYDAIIALWTRSEGVRVRAADSREGVARYLSRYQGWSFVANNDSSPNT